MTGQFSAIDELLTGLGNLRLMAGLWLSARHETAPAVVELLGRFGLIETAEGRAATYPGNRARSPRNTSSWHRTGPATPTDK